MKAKVFALALALTPGLVSCGGDGGGTLTDQGGAPTFTVSDIVGAWSGTASNASGTLQLDLQVDASGNVSGSDVSSVWSIDSSGRVTGSGSLSVMAGSSLIVANASWSLQMNDAKNKLSGNCDASHPALHDMSVTLTKQ